MRAWLSWFPWAPKHLDGWMPFDECSITICGRLKEFTSSPSLMWEQLSLSFQAASRKARKNSLSASHFLEIHLMSVQEQEASWAPHWGQDSSLAPPLTSCISLGKLHSPPKIQPFPPLKNLDNEFLPREGSWRLNQIMHDKSQTIIYRVTFYLLAVVQYPPFQHKDHSENGPGGQWCTGQPLASVQTACGQ